MKDALKIEQLDVQIKNQHILKNFSLKLDQGDILCLLGPSGCGKTTALKAIAGLIKTQNGRIELFNQTLKDELTELPPEKRGMGFIFQDYALFPHLTVFENIAFALKGQDKSIITSNVSKHLSLVRLDGLEQRYPHQLSGGQQQRTAVARALSNQPKLLLMDEPFSNIDNQVKHKMMAELRQLLKANNMTCIFVTHSKHEAFSFADKTAVMHQGKVEQMDITRNIYEHPDNLFVAQFMEAGNIIPCADIADNLFSIGKCENSGFYLLKENGFTLSSDGAKGLVKDCLYIGYRYRIEAALENQSKSIYFEADEPMNIDSEIFLKYTHEPTVIAE